MEIIEFSLGLGQLMWAKSTKNGTNPQISVKTSSSSRIWIVTEDNMSNFLI